MTDRFQLWVCKDVIPSIRLQGEYKVSNEINFQLKRANEALEEQIQRTEKKFKLDLEAKTEENRHLQQINNENETRISKMRNELEVSKITATWATNEIKEVEKHLSFLKHKEGEAQSKVRDLSRELKRLELKEEQSHGIIENLDKTVEKQQSFIQEVGQTTRSIRDLYLIDPIRATDPTITRLDWFRFRSQTFMILHEVAFYCIKGWLYVHGTRISWYDLTVATNKIMSVTEEDYEELSARECTNPILYYTRTLTKIAKSRLPSTAKYSSEMNIQHLYLYSKRLSAWCQRYLGIDSVNYHTEIEAFYGKKLVSKFSFKTRSDTTIQTELLSQEPEAITLLDNRRLD